MAYNTDHDWIDEAEAEQAAVPRGHASPLGVPIVTAVLGLLVGVLGTSMWWSWAGPSSPRVASSPPVAAAAPKPLAPAPTVVVATPAASPVASPAAAEPAPLVAATVPRDSDDAPATPAPLAASPSTPSALSPEEIARRKERAWARFYKRPASCDGNPSTDQLIECGNHFIRAKREFDERWRTGSL